MFKLAVMGFDASIASNSFESQEIVARKRRLNLPLKNKIDFDAFNKKKNSSGSEFKGATYVDFVS